MPGNNLKSLLSSVTRFFGQMRPGSICIRMMEREKSGEGEEQRRTNTFFAKNGRGRVITCAYVAANGKESLLFIDDVTVDSSIRMNCMVYMVIVFAHIQPKARKLMNGNSHFTCNECG